MGIWAKFTRFFSGNGDYTGYQNGEPISIPVADAKTYTPDAATQLGTVWACVNLISETIASIPIDIYSFDKDGKRTAGKCLCSYHQEDRRDRVYTLSAERGSDECQA